MRTVITHPELGIFVGQSLGLAFFSMLDNAGQTTVATFIDEREAREFVAAWDDHNDPDSYNYVNVATDSDFAEVPELAAAGLSHLLGSLMEGMPVAGRC